MEFFEERFGNGETMTTLILIEKGKAERVDFPKYFFKEFDSECDIILVALDISDENLEAVRAEAEKRKRTFGVTTISEYFGSSVKSDIVLVKSEEKELTKESRAAASMICAHVKPDSVIVYSSYPLLRNVSTSIVPDAYVIEELSFEEAESFLYYGAPMMDITGIYKAVNQGVKVTLKSFCEEGGIIISSKPSKKAQKKIVKGFAAISGVSIITLEGIGFKGVSGTMTKFANACSDAGVSFLMIAQGASESAISVVVKDKDAGLAAMSINKAFEDQILSEMCEPVKIDNNNAIIAAVGDSITDSPVFVSAFYSAFSSFNVTIKLSTLTRGDNSLCAVIRTNDIKKALSGLNASFCLSKVTISMGIFGAGNVGGELLSQIAGQEDELNRKGIDIRVRAIANSKRMLLSNVGVDLSDWRKEFEKNAVALDVDGMVDFIDNDAYPHTLIVDCTASESLPLRYVEWFERGIHIVTPNKKGGVTDYKYYSEMMETAKKNNCMYLRETTVGAGLPVISTLNDLIKTGDEIKGISGIVSGTLAYLFSEYDGKVPFSKLVLKAKEMGYTEPDPREDLSGMDVARKAIILSRELGSSAELKRLDVESLIPESLKSVPYEEFVKRISEIDDKVKKLYDKAVKEGKVLRYTAEVGADGSCSVQLASYDKDHVFAQTKGTDNVFVFHTKRYDKGPLVVKGPGAGLEVTAGGVFADLLKLCSFLGVSY